MFHVIVRLFHASDIDHQYNFYTGVMATRCKFNDQSKFKILKIIIYA